MFIFSTENIHYINRENAAQKWGILLYCSKALIGAGQNPHKSVKNPCKKTAQRWRQVSRAPAWAVCVIVDSRKSFESRESLVALRVAVRVDKITLSNVLCVIVGVVLLIGGQHIFGLVLIPIVVLAEEDTRNRVNFATVHVIFP